MSTSKKFFICGVEVETLIISLLSPMAFAVGILMQFLAQTMIALGFMSNGWQVYAVSALLAMTFGLMAQLRGSWIWVK